MPTVKTAKRKAIKVETTKPNHPWDRAARLTLHRDCPRAPFWGEKALDPGVNYFVLQLERLGATTHFSCEGHPTGFYISFECDEALARRIKGCGFFSVEVETSDQSWSLRNSHIKTEKDRHHIMRFAAEAWEREFGPLNIPET